VHAGVSDHAGPAEARADAPARMAFRYSNNVGTRDCRPFAAQWPACTLPCRRFAGTLAGADARLGAGVDRYSFTVMDFHHLLLAGLPAHYCRRIQATGARAAKGVTRVWARGRPSSQLTIRDTFIAAAMQTC
jgi:hypothetical protein